MTTPRRLLALSLMVLCHAVPARAESFTPGLYEIETQMSMAGAAMPSRTVRQCLSEKDYVPNDGSDALHCKVADQHIDGGRVTWTVQCDGQVHATARYAGTYAGDHFTSDGVMEMRQDGQSVTMQVRQAGHRVGPCPKQ